MPIAGRIRMYTSGWPKYQKRCCQSSGSPPPDGRNQLVPSVRSKSSMATADVRTGSARRSRMAGMKLFRMPLVIWTLFITAILLLLALPVLTSAVAMLLFDRTLGTSWFAPSGGGEPLLWQHLFWYFGHPEVYILILPAMGIASEIL